MDYVMIKNKIFTENSPWFDEENFNDFPPLTLEVSYEDLVGKRYKTIYNFKLKCSNSFYQQNFNSINTKEEFAFLSFSIE